MPLSRALALGIVLVGGLMAAQALSPRATPLGTPAPPSVETSPPLSSGAVVTTGPTAAAAIPEGYRIRIPRLGIDLPVAEGIVQRDVEQQRTPEGFAFHLPGTSIPGAPGNAFIYAHARVGLFISLWDARVGDEVDVATPDGRTLRYAVSEIRPRVAPSDVSVAEPTEDERLTLQTSTGPAPEDPRFVVVALPRS